MAALTVQLTGGPPWGFRLHGGRGQNIPLTVAKVRRKSKSYGYLVEGDEILSIGGKTVQGLSHDEAMALVDSHADKLDLSLRRSGSSSVPIPHSTSMESADVATGPPKTSSVISSSHSSFQQSACHGSQSVPSAFESALSNTGSAGSAGSVGAELAKASQQQPTSLRSDSDLDASSRFQPSTGTSDMEIKTERKSNEGSTTVNISGAKFDLGSDFRALTPLAVDSTSGRNNVSNPFAGMERILESESRSSKENIPGGDLKRFESRQTKTVDGAYVQSHTTTTQKSSVSSTAEPLSITCNPHCSLDDKMLISPSGKLIKERYYKPLTEEQQKEIDDIMAPILNKKKVFTSSSFYVDENCTYPTVEEQVGMARKIAESLSSDSNKLSKGANMFFRRVKRSHKWVHQAPGICESEFTQSEDCSTFPDGDNFPGVRISKEPPKLKLLMAPAVSKDHWDMPTQDLTVSPEVCLDIVKGLNSPSGKGAQMFAKRKKKSEDWVVDVDKLRAQLGDKWPEKHMENDGAQVASLAPVPPPKPSVQTPRAQTPRAQTPRAQTPRVRTPADRYLEQISPQPSRIRLIRSPWEAASESPIGAVDAAFQTIDESASRVAACVETRAPFSKLPVADVSLVTPYREVANDLTARLPRGWGTTQNVCVTVKQPESPPTPPPRPKTIRPPKYDTRPNFTADVQRSGPSFEPLPPAQFFNALGERIEDFPSFTVPGQEQLTTQAEQAQLFNPYACQNFNSAPRGYGSPGGRHFRSVRL